VTEFLDVAQLIGSAPIRPIDIRRLQYVCPSVHSIQSRGFRIRRSSSASQVTLNVDAALLTLPPGPTWLLEILGRWACVRASLSRARAAGNLVVSDAVSRKWARLMLSRAIIGYAATRTKSRRRVVSELSRLLDIDDELGTWRTGSDREVLLESVIEKYERDLAESTHESSRLQEAWFQPPTGRIVAFLRQSVDGVLLPIFAHRRFRFRSQYNAPVRQVSHDELEVQPRVAVANNNNESPEIWRNVFRQEITFVEAGAAIRRTTQYWRLPDNFRGWLDAGYVPVTSPNSAADCESEFSVLMYGATMPASEGQPFISGRTGVLFHRGAPVVVSIGSCEYVIELKGMGSPSGGFPRAIRRLNGSRAIAGGLLEGYGEDEFDQLCSADFHQQSAPAPRPAALIRFKRGERLLYDGDTETAAASEGQAVLIRLVPSVERLSYTPGAKRLDSYGRNSASISGISQLGRVELYGMAIASLFTRSDPKGHLSAHLENVIAGVFGCCWTDFADVVPLYVSRAHYRSLECADRSALTLNVLNRTFFYVAKTAQLFHRAFAIPYEQFSCTFYKSFIEKLAVTWPVDVETFNELCSAREPLRTSTGVGITNFLWERLFVAHNFEWCLNNYDAPAIIWEVGRQQQMSLARRQVLDGEITFLTQAQRHVARSQEWGHLKNELELNIYAMEELSCCDDKVLAERLPLLPYYQKSITRPLPRCPKSWTPEQRYEGTRR